MSNIFKIAFAAVVLCIASTRSNAEDIVWDQPSPEAAYHQNLHFEGNAVLHKSDVRKLQKSLAMKGFYKGKIDGIWGGKTTQAILDYQAIHQQALTGTVTPETLRDLGVYADAKSYQSRE